MLAFRAIAPSTSRHTVEYYNESTWFSPAVHEDGQEEPPCLSSATFLMIDMPSEHARRAFPLRNPGVYFFDKSGANSLDLALRYSTLFTALFISHRKSLSVWAGDQSYPVAA